MGRFCSRCKTEKEPTEFYKLKDGFQRWCKDCQKAVLKEPKYREYQKRFRASDKRKRYEKIYHKSYWQRDYVKAKAKDRQSTIEYKNYMRWYRLRPEAAKKKRERESADAIARRLRIPKWADFSEIKLFYENCPEGMVVDHIIPLRGKNVSGLHVLENLQYMTPEENFRKNNKYPYFKEDANRG